MNENKQNFAELAKRIAALIALMSVEDKGYILGVAETLANKVYVRPPQPPEPKKTA